MALGTTTFTAVSWTTGDTITEVKMDAMQANTQAYDSHAAEGLLLNNTVGYWQKDVGGTARSVANVGSGDVIVYGDANLDGAYMIHGCYLLKASTQSIGSGANVAITFAAADELYDPLGMHNSTSNTDRITFAEAGIYEIHAFAKFVDIAGSTRTAIIYKNGALYNPGGGGVVASAAPDSSGRWGLAINTLIDAAANDYVSLYVFQNTGVNRNIEVASLTAKMVGPT